MHVVLMLFVYSLRFIYLFFKLLPTQNKITFISRQVDKPSLDFVMLKEEIVAIDENVKIVFVTKKMKKNLLSGLRSIKMIFIQLYHLATSRVCITDGYNIPISVLNHKKSLKVFQIWHSLGAIKKFGYQSLDTSKKKKQARILCMHKNYDYITCSSKMMIKHFSKSFNYDKNVFHPIGLPRVDYLLEQSVNNQEKIYDIYPEFKNQKVILYAPTFRDNNNYKINELIDAIDLTKYILIIKVHPNMDYEINYQDNIYSCEEFNALQLLSVSDYVITDYSGIAIEASVLEKPIYLYVYDLKEYSEAPGINTNLKKDLPNCVFESAQDLYEELSSDNYNLKVVKEYKEKYVPNYNGTATKELAKFIIEKGLVNEED